MCTIIWYDRIIEVFRNQWILFYFQSNSIQHFIKNCIDFNSNYILLTFYRCPFVTWWVCHLLWTDCCIHTCNTDIIFSQCRSLQHGCIMLHKEIYKLQTWLRYYLTQGLICYQVRQILLILWCEHSYIYKHISNAHILKLRNLNKRG